VLEAVDFVPQMKTWWGVCMEKSVLVNVAVHPCCISGARPKRLSDRSLLLKIYARTVMVVWGKLAKRVIHAPLATTNSVRR
jgi:hypothetical protein